VGGLAGRISPDAEMRAHKLKERKKEGWMDGWMDGWIDMKSRLAISR
jgi:hypothetical protein